MNIMTEKRGFKRENVGKLTIFQGIGFVLISLSVVYFVFLVLPCENFNNLDVLASRDIPIAFFTIMFGFAFAFPDMLEDQNKDVSTMRIIVFMFANVICMLFLKMGLSADNLQLIKLDYYWLSFIVLLFGAKVTQSYFENKPSSPTSNITNSINTELSEIAIAQLAKIQNEQELRNMNHNIVIVSDTLSRDRKRCVTIYLKDDDVGTIPKIIKAEINEGYTIDVPVEIVTNFGEGIPHSGKSRFIQLTNNIADSRNPDYVGSIGCLVQDLHNSNIKGVVTSGHIFTNGKFEEHVEDFDLNQDAISNGAKIGSLYFMELNENQDLAIVRLEDDSSLIKAYQSFSGFYDLSYRDYFLEVTVLSQNNKSRSAYILDFNLSNPLQVKYEFNTNIFMRNIILIGSTKDRENSKPVSEGSDSGSCVYLSDTNQLIGILLGSDKENFSFVLPIKNTLKNKFKLI